MESKRTYCTCRQSSLELAWCILPLCTSWVWLRGADKDPATSQYECSLQLDNTVVCALEASHNACLCPYPPLLQCTVSFAPAVCVVQALCGVCTRVATCVGNTARPKHGKLNARLCHRSCELSPDDRRLMKLLACWTDFNAKHIEQFGIPC
jgi:hypothetical protein